MSRRDGVACQGLVVCKATSICPIRTGRNAMYFAKLAPHMRRIREATGRGNLRHRSIRSPQQPCSRSQPQMPRVRQRRLTRLNLEKTLQLAHGHVDPGSQFVQTQRLPDVLLHQMHDPFDAWVVHRLRTGRMRLRRAGPLRIFNEKNAQCLLHRRGVDMQLQNRRRHVDRSTPARTRNSPTVDDKQPVRDE